MERLPINIVAISDDPAGGWDVNLSVNGKALTIWCNYSCSEMKVIKSTFFFLKTKERIQRILNGVYDLVMIENNLTPSKYVC